MFKKILVAVDGSEHAKHAVTVGAKIARQFDGELILLHVMRHLGSDRVPEGMSELERIEHIRLTEADLLRNVAQSILDEAKDLAGAEGMANAATAFEEGDPAARMIEYCKANEIDLIVLGRRGLGRLTGLLMGSVSQKVSQVAPCACLTVPDG